MNEAETRKEIIDRELSKRGWDLKNPSQVIVEFEMESRFPEENKIKVQAEEYGTSFSGKEFADYLLLSRDGATPFAVVEAKRTSKNPRLGQQQAVGYAENIKSKFGVDPFIFLTNGESTLFWDRSRYAPRKVYGFFDIKDLERLKYLREQQVDPTILEIRKDIASRVYQHEAIRRTIETFSKGHRKALIVMATGTGKTRTAMALIDLLIRAKWVNHVLFLADRKMLRDQAYGKKGFQGFFTESMTKIKSGSFDKNQRLYASTIQTLEEVYREISPGFFDLIIIDECHRSIYNKWQDILSYFDALQVGLTATPAEFVDRDTFRFFQCDEGHPTFNYTYESAIEEEILVPFIPYHAKTNFQIKGLKSGQIPEEIRKKLVEEGKTEEELDFEGTDFEKKFTNKESLESMVKEFMEVCNKDETGSLPGKTIYFAISKEHAYRLLDTFERLYPEYKGRLAEVIVSDDSRADGFLTRFENDSFPRIAISVDMLDTGVDIREVVNLVFAKPVFSKIKFWQMIGRGTRTIDSENAKPWCAFKDSFLIIDHWSNFEYFNLKPEGEIQAPQDSLPTRLFRLRLQKLKLQLASQNQEACEAIKQDLLTSIRALPQDSVTILEKKESLTRVLSEAFWKHIDIGYLEKEIAPLLRFTQDVNLNIYAFLIKCERLEIAAISKEEKAIKEIGESIREDLRLLPLNLRQIQQKEEQVLRASSDRFWSSFQMNEVGFLKTEIAPLMKWRRERTHTVIEFDLKDEILERKWIEFGPSGEGDYVHQYKEKVEKEIRTLADQDSALKKIKEGHPVSEEELDRLEDKLNQPDLYINERNLRETYGQPTGTFKQFLLKIFDKYDFPSREQLIQRSFETFVHEKPWFSADQIHFLRIVKNVFIEKCKRREKLSVHDFYEGPFEALGQDAADKLFKKNELEEIVEFFNSQAA